MTRSRRHNQLSAVAVIAAAALLMVFEGDALAAACRWTKTTGITNWNASTANWSCSAIPGASDDVTFDGTHSGSCTISAAGLNVNSITIQSGYTGTVAAGSGIGFAVYSNFSQAGGTFTGSSGDIYISGSLLLSGGIFTSTSGILAIYVAFTKTGGTFNHNSGRLFLGSTVNQTFATGGATFNDVYINDGLQRYFKFDEASGPSTDSAGYASDAIWNGSTSTSASYAATALAFANARGAYFGTASTDDAHFSSPAMTKITISTWFQVTSEPNTNPRLIDMPGYVLLTRPTGDGEAARSLQFDVLRSGNFPSWRTAASAFAVGTWYHLAVTYDGTTYTNVPKLYINGVSQSLTQRTAPANNAQTSNSGTGYIGNNSGHIRVFGGYLDDMRLYDRVLTATEISSLAIGRQPGTYVATQAMTGVPTISGDLVIASGKLTTGANNISLGGNWYNYGGIYLATGGVLTMTGTASSAIKILSAGSRFQGVIFNGSGKTFTLADNMDTDPSESIITTAGTFALSTYTLRTGDVNRNGAVTLTPNTGKLVYYTDTDHILDTGTYYDLELEPVSATNLKGYWKFDELQGDAVYDYATGASYDGAINGTPSWTTSGATAIDFYNRGALQFGGSGDYVDIGAAVTNTHAAFSACAWTNLNSLAKQTVLAMDGTNISSFVLQLKTDNGVKFAFVTFSSDNTGATQYQINANSAASTGTWYHLCGTYDGTTERLYVNGTLQTATLAASPFQATGRTTIGADYWSSAHADYLNGTVDDVRIYNIALTATQIAALAAGDYPKGLAGAPTYSLSYDSTVSGTFKMHSGTFSPGAYTLNASAAGNVATIYGGTYTVGSVAQTFAGGLNVPLYGTLNLPTSSGSVKIGSTKTLNIDGTLSASNTGATIQTAGGASTYYNFNVGTSATATPTLNITGLAVKNTTSNGMYINSVAGSSTTFTNFNNIAFSGGTGSYLLRIYATSLALYGNGLTFDASTTSNLKLAGNGTGDGETRTYFGATCTSTPCESYDVDDDSEPDGTGDTANGTGDEAVAQWMRGAYDDTSGSIQGFPTTAFDWNTFVYWNTYVAYRDYNGSVDRLYARNTDGAYLNTAGGAGYYWDLPGSVGDIIGTPRWTQEGVSPGAVTHYVYILTTLGYVYKLSDSGTAFTLVAAQAWPYHNGASATATSALAMDSNNVYWAGRDGANARQMFSLTTAMVLNGTRPVVADVVASPALATVSSVDYLFTATNGKIYRTPTNVASEITSTVATSIVYGRITPYFGKVYFPEDIGKVWALSATDLSTSWASPYQDTDATRHPGGCSANSQCTVRNLYLDASLTRLYFGDKDGHVYVLTSTGAILNGNYPFRPGLSTDEFQTAPLYRSGVIVIGSTTGKVFVIDQNNGTGPALYQTFNFQSAVSTISYDTDGYYIVGTADGKLYYLNGVTDPTSGSI